MAEPSSVFLECDRERLIRRLRAITAGDLATRQLERLADGDMSVLEDLPLSTRQGVAALMNMAVTPRGELERMVGAQLDFVSVAFLDLARTAADAVGRVVDQQRRAVGTGTLVSPRLFLTNSHVSPDPATTARQLVQLGYELGVDGTPRAPAEFRLEPDTFFWTSPPAELDATLVAVGAPVAQGEELRRFGYCGLSAAGDKHAEGDYVTVIQHPAGDFKQIALRENRVLGRGKKGTTLHYSADTLGGSSGSPVFNDQFELVALHHAGGHVNETELENGQAVPAQSNEGIRISAVAGKLREVLDVTPDPFRALLAEALDPPIGRFGIAPALGQVEADLPVAVAVPPAVPAAPGLVLPGEVALPLRATIVVPTPVGTGPPAAGGSPVGRPSMMGQVERNQVPDDDYERRRGYDPEFLNARSVSADATVPLPKLPPPQRRMAAVPANGLRTQDAPVLRYLHFSVVQNAQRRMPFFTAVNIDGKRSRSINRQTGEVEASETWYVDPRIASDEQLSQSHFDQQRPRLFDRGHMVRRLDPAWGSATTARRASDDTFHFTNCALQISAFNQRAQLWAGIEDYVLDKAKAERKRVSVFTGPVFGPEDPVYRGVAVPRAFWKVVVRLEAAALRVTAFRADQGVLLDAALGQGGTEGFADLGTVATFQISLATLEAETGLSFGDLTAHDTYALEAVQGVELRSLDQVTW